MNTHHEVLVCGVDCRPGDTRCNGYCDGKESHPPVAPDDIVRDRKKRRAIQHLCHTVDLWREYVHSCPSSHESLFANEILDKLTDIERTLPVRP